MNGSKLDRRQFLQLSALAALGIVAAPVLRFPRAAGLALGGAEASAAAVPSGETILYVFCRGGMDPLSFFPPLAGTALRSRYDAYRPNIRYDSLATAAGGAFGANAQIPELKQMIDAGDLSVVLGLGSVNETMSHFNQMDYVEGGNSSRRLPEGLFQRLSSVCGFQGGTSLVALEASVPRSLRGHSPVFQFQRLTDLGNLAMPGVQAAYSKQERLANNFLSTVATRTMAPAFSQSSAAVFAAMSGLEKGAIPVESLAEAGRLLRSGISPRVIATSVDGWDFHSDLKSRFTGENGLGKKLVQSLKALVEELRAAGKLSTTTIVVMSEFGRRIVENGARGCDHGRGGMALVLGGPVRGGRIVLAPGYVSDLIARYDSVDRKQMNLPVNYDYRVLLEEIFRKRLLVDPAVSVGTIFGESSIAGISPGSAPVLNLILG